VLGRSVFQKFKLQLDFRVYCGKRTIIATFFEKTLKTRESLNRLCAHFFGDMYWNRHKNSFKLTKDQDKLKTELEQLKKERNALKKAMGECPDLKAPNTYSAADIVNLYSRYFDHWEHSRDERTQYNQFFIRLLFIETLVALLGAIISNIKTSSGSYLTAGYPQLFAIIVFGIGAVIAFIWVLKLQVMNHRDDEQLNVLKKMEACLPYRFQAVGTEVKCQTEGSRRLLRDIFCLLGIYHPKGPCPKAKTCLKNERRWTKFCFVLQGFADILNYYGIAWLLWLVFLALSVLAYKRPDLLHLSV